MNNPYYVYYRIHGMCRIHQRHMYTYICIYVVYIYILSETIATYDSASMRSTLHVGLRVQT